ncbi:MAG: hypothetical protein KC466_06040 [Myxococcales bacterium]|nr:hypothetical protein [Myxococcales bacterium]
MRVLALVPLLALGAACAPVAPMTGRSDRGRPPSIAPAPRPAEASPLDLEPLTLERAQALVLAHNPGLAAARGALGAA